MLTSVKGKTVFKSVKDWFLHFFSEFFHIRVLTRKYVHFATTLLNRCSEIDLVYITE